MVTAARLGDALPGITIAFGAAAGADIFGHMGICGMDQAGSPDNRWPHIAEIVFRELTGKK